MTCVLVIAPHPDDETLGCGGTLSKHVEAGDEVHWLVVTAMLPEYGFSPDKIAARADELDRVNARYGFAGRHHLDLPSTRLDTLPLGDVIGRMAAAIGAVRPDCVYLPWPGDAHSDHKVVFDAATAGLKWFRAPGIRRVLAYETASETGFNMSPLIPDFRPNWFVDISGRVEEKIATMGLYAGEMGAFPFPRSAEAIAAQARMRGALCGCEAAEAFVLLKGMA